MDCMSLSLQQKFPQIVFVAHNIQLGITGQTHRVPAGHSAHVGTIQVTNPRANVTFCLLPLVQNSHFYADLRLYH